MFKWWQFEKWQKILFSVKWSIFFDSVTNDQTELHRNLRGWTGHWQQIKLFSYMPQDQWFPYSRRMKRVLGWPKKLWWLRGWHYYLSEMPTCKYPRERFPNEQQTNWILWGFYTGESSTTAINSSRRRRIREKSSSATWIKPQIEENPSLFTIAALKLSGPTVECTLALAIYQGAS